MAITDWLEQNIDDRLQYTGNGREVHFNCPVCNETRHRMYVNLYNGKTYCHNCNFKGTIVTLIQKVEGVTDEKAKKVFESIKDGIVLPDHVADDMVDRILAGDISKEIERRPIPLPEEYRLLNPKKTNIRTKRAIKYLHSRGITDQQIVDSNLGYCMSGDYANRVIIPITREGKTEFWVARAISSTERLKEKSPQNESYQISKSQVIYNLDVAAKKYNAIVICEGIFDSMAYLDLGVSLLGKRLYNDQLSLLLEYRKYLTKGVYISLDWDARADAVQMAEKLHEYFDAVYLINLKPEDDDPNAALLKKGRSYMWELVANATKWDNYSLLEQKLANC